MRRKAVLAASFVAILGAGCEKKNPPGFISSSIGARDGHCMKVSRCMPAETDLSGSPPVCATPVPGPENVDCPVAMTARMPDGTCVYPLDPEPEMKYGNVGNPPPPPEPVPVPCPQGVKDYVPLNIGGLGTKKPAAPSASTAAPP